MKIDAETAGEISDYRHIIAFRNILMAVIRWWSQKVDKQNVVARSNEHYGIPRRSFVTNESKAKTVNPSQLDRVRDEHVRMSLELQQAFGLRREEAMKFQPIFSRYVR